MRTLELFAGTKSFSKVAKELGHQTFTVELDPRFEPDWCGDVRDYLAGHEHLLRDYVLWASPPCQGFSVAVIGRNWNHDATPKTDSARLAMELVRSTLEIIRRTKPKYWFIENPRGMLRKMPWMDEFMREQGGGPADRVVLLLRRHAPEAHRYLDELHGLGAAAHLQARSRLPRGRATRIPDRYARTGQRHGARRHPAGTV